VVPNLHSFYCWSRAAAWLVTASCFVVSLAAADWDRFRGPNGSGLQQESPLPAEFGPARNVAWKIALPPGHSSPVLAGGRIYLTAFENEKLITYCLSQKDGEIVWRREIARTRKEEYDKRNGPASSTPVWDGKNLYVFFPDLGLVSYDAQGKERWRVPLGPFNNIYGLGVSPVVSGDKVFIVVDQSFGSHIAAFRTSDGKQVWRKDRPEAVSGASTPIVLPQKRGPALIVAPGSFRMDAYSADTGDVVWYVRGLASEMKSVPVLTEYDGQQWIFLNGYNIPENDPGKQIAIPEFADVVAKVDADKNGKISAAEAPDEPTKRNFPFIDLDKDGGMDAREWRQYQATMSAVNAVLAIRVDAAKGDITTTNVVWRYHRAVPQLPSLLLYRDVLFMINDAGVLTTFEPKTGNVIQQARLRGVSDRYYASPVGGDGKVYIAAHSGVVTVLEASGKHNVLAANNLEEEIFATPAIGDGRIYVRTRNTLYCFGTTHR